jgi:hypothetical protein
MSIKSKLGFLQAATQTGDKEHPPIVRDYTLAAALAEWTQSDLPDLPANGEDLKNYADGLKLASTQGMKSHLVCLNFKDPKWAANNPADVQALITDTIGQLPIIGALIIGREKNWTTDASGKLIPTDAALQARIYVNCRKALINYPVYHTNLGAPDKPETGIWYEEFLHALPANIPIRAAISWLGAGTAHAVKLIEARQKMVQTQIAVLKRRLPWIVAENGAPGPYARPPQSCAMQASNLIVSTSAALNMGAERIFFAPGLQNAPAPDASWYGWGMVDEIGNPTETYHLMEKFINA